MCDELHVFPSPIQTFDLGRGPDLDWIWDLGLGLKLDNKNESRI